LDIDLYRWIETNVGYENAIIGGRIDGCSVRIEKLKFGKP